MLTAILAAALAAFAQSGGSSAPVFDAISIKRTTAPQEGGLAAMREDINTSAGTLRMRNVRLSTCIRWAYSLNVYELQGPDWIDNERYDIVAKANGAAPESQLRLMLQAALAERTKLQAHRQETMIPGYALVRGKEEPKLQRAEGGGEGSMTGAGMVFEGHKMPISRLADILASALKAPVENGTGLEGYYDFKLDMRRYIAARQPGDPPLDLASIATTAFREELGLRLEARKLRLQVLTVDRVEQPTEN